MKAMTNIFNNIAKSRLKRRLFVVVGVLTMMFCSTLVAYAEPAVEVAINGEGSDTVRIIIILTLITLAPFMLLMMTCFTRIIIVLSFLRSALGLQSSPPNQVLIGIAIFVTFFIMQPVINEVNETAFQPYNEGIIETQEFLDTAAVPMKAWMLNQTTQDDVDLFTEMSTTDYTNVTGTDLPMSIVIPSFILSELKRAFLIGFLIFVPFLIIDLVVASTLMSLGMIMLPPVTISLPFKIMLFVVVDGWGLLIETLVMTYN